MPNNKPENIDSFILALQSKGRYTFSLDEANNVTDKSRTAVKSELDRLKKKGSIVAVRKGFYTIVPPEYRQIGLMPPELFINQMMQWLNKPYYIGLLSAASLLGAAHQQPQELFVVTQKTALRTIEKKGYKIRFIINNNWMNDGITEMKSDTGFIKVSSPELTLIDLVSFYKTIGGINRAATVILELLPEINVNKLKKLLQSGVQTTTIQRLGYIANLAGDSPKLIGAIEEVLRKRKTFWIPLLPGKQKNQVGNKISQWKIIENITLETDI